MDYDRQEEGLELRAIVAALRRRVWVLIVCVALAAVAAVAVSLLAPREYESEATLLFRYPTVEQRLMRMPPTDSAEARGRQLATTLALEPVIVDRTLARLGRPVDPEKDIVVEPTEESDVVAVTADGEDQAAATELANVYADEFAAFVAEQDARAIEQARQAATGTRAEEVDALEDSELRTLEVIRAATPETTGRNVLRNGVLGAFAGLLLSLGLVFLIERLDRRLRTPRDVEQLSPGPVIAAIPKSRSIGETTPTRELSPPESEAFALLWANLRHYNSGRRIRSILVTSPAEGDGKTTTALHLALAAARAGSSVLIIEADQRRPAIAERLGLVPDRGFADVVSGRAELSEVVQEASVDPNAGRGEASVAVAAIPVGGSYITGAQAATRMRELVEAADREYDLTVIDAPPVSLVADAIPLVHLVSGVLVVTRLGATTRAAATRLDAHLRSLGAPVLGIVVNSVARGDEVVYGTASNQPPSHAAHGLRPTSRPER